MHAACSHGPPQRSPYVLHPSREDIVMAAGLDRKAFVARLAALLLAALIVAGIVVYGFSAEVRTRVWQDLIDRPGGPMTFRVILQPIMAAVAALFDAIQDAKTGRSPYFWTIISNPAERSGRLREGVVSTGRIILLGIGIDVIYQILFLKTFYPEAAIVAIALAFLPYLLLRGPLARLVRWWRHAPNADEGR